MEEVFHGFLHFFIIFVVCLGAAGNAGGYVDSAAACHSMPLGRHDCGSRVRKV